MLQSFYVWVWEKPFVQIGVLWKFSTNNIYGIMNISFLISRYPFTIYHMVNDELTRSFQSRPYDVTAFVSSTTIQIKL